MTSIRSRSGFTLIEIMIVLAVITTLAALIIIAVLPNLRRSRAAADLGQLPTIASSIALYYNDGSLPQPMPLTEGTSVPHSTSLTASQIAQLATIDEVLSVTRITTTPYQWSAASNWDSYLKTVVYNKTTNQWEGAGFAETPDANMPTIECRVSDPTTAPSAAQGGNFRLDGETNLPPNARVFYVRIPNVSASTAYAYAEASLKEALLPADRSVACNAGVVAYAAPVGDSTDVYLYITHR